MNGTRQVPAKAWLLSAANSTHDSPTALIICAPRSAATQRNSLNRRLFRRSSFLGYPDAQARCSHDARPPRASRSRHSPSNPNPPKTTQRKLMTELKLTLVVACALVDADRRVLLAQRPA